MHESRACTSTFHHLISILISRRLNGKELDGLSFNELQQLENQLNEGIVAVKEQKVLKSISFPSYYTFSL